jgi:opacity protein-like surface antigen
LKTFIFASCMVIFAGALSAQALFDRVAYNLGGGLTETVLTTNKNLANGWNGQLGVGYKFTPHLDVMVNVEYDHLRISNSALSALGTPQGYPGGYARNESVTLNPVWHLRAKGSWDVYVTGGGGAYQRMQVLSRPTVATATGTDSFFGFNSPGYPASEVNLTYTVNKPGLDVGAGVSLKMKYHMKLYVEGRYNHVFMGSLGHMDYAPISLGVRW